MLSPVTPNNLLKMHWSGDHGAPLSPWAEQHLDVSSTTSPPGGHHKHHNVADPYGARRPGYAPPAAASGYPTWASDDISALSASSLLKRYAEKYSGLELPCYDSSSSRPPCYAAEGPPPPPGPYLKTEVEPWGAPPPSALECYPGLEALAGGKVAVVAASDTGYGSASSPQDYPPAPYNGSSYLPAGYCPQPHALQSSYSPSTAVYNYPPVGCYPSPHTYSHPGASYPPPLPLGPPRPTVVGGSGYGGYSPASHTSLGGGGSPEGGVVALKRKAFEMSEDGEEGGGAAEDEDSSSRYRKYGNGHGGANKSHGGSSNNNGHYGMGSPSAPPPDPHDAYKSERKPLMSPPYGGAGDYSPPAGGLSGEGGAGAERHGFPPQQRMTVKMPAAHARSEDPTGGR